MMKAQHVEVVEERKHDLILKVRTKHSKYINEFLQLKCGPDLLALKLFPNAKEITESLAAYHAVKDYVGIYTIQDHSVKAIDVACGHMPRTAALMAFRTPWECAAVDPNVRAKKTTLQRIKRLELHPKLIQDCRLKHNGLVIVTAVHPHVSIANILAGISAPHIVLVAIECCQPLHYHVPPVLEYDDHFCWSPKRTVRVWDLQGENV